MKQIMILPLIMFSGECMITLKNYYMFRRSGEISKRFKHNSDLKFASLIVLILSTIFYFWIKGNYHEYIFNSQFLILYAIIIVINYHREILLMDEGIFINGRLIKWDGIKGIKVYDKQSLILETMGSWSKVQIVNRVKMIDELTDLLKDKVN